MIKTAVCHRVRRELLREVDRVSGATARHLERCAACEDFAARLSATRDHLVAHRARVVPDTGFSARVIAALPVRQANREAMSWAALRLLPAAVALALVLGVWSWLATSSPASLADSAPTDDLLSWVLENGS